MTRMSHFAQLGRDEKEKERLIAAAPEMLEALRLIARSSGFKDGTWVGELQEIARAAIAKAEGRVTFNDLHLNDPTKNA